MEKLKWKKPWGPKRFQEAFEWLIAGVNARTPIKGIGIELDEKPDGCQISVSPSVSGDKLSPDSGGAGGGSGTPTDIYGALNGQPALFHLLQSSPPTLVT